MPMRKQARAVAILTVLALCALAAAVRAQGRGQAQAAAGRGCNLPEPFPCPVARILELTAAPPTINPGESARITWSAENPTNITLSPGVGRVEARGTSTGVALRDNDVYPADRGRAERGGRHPHGDARRAGDSTRGGRRHHSGPRSIPRTPDGKPDLQGVWFGGGFRTHRLRRVPLVFATRPTPKPGLEASLKIVNDPFEIGAGCGVRSVPVYFGPGYRFQIVQTPTTIVQLIERMHLHRIFQIGAEHSDDVMNGEELSFLGDSIARWDGDTLVIDTRGFNARTAVGTDEGAFTGGLQALAEAAPGRASAANRLRHARDRVHAGRSRPLYRSLAPDDEAWAASRVQPGA